MIRKLIHGKLSGYRANKPAHPLLLSERQFSRLLRIERQRADRRHLPFCVIDIVLDHANGSRKHIGLLARLLYKRLRATDQQGSTGPVTLGVLLADTPEMGGRFVLNDLEHLIAEEGLQVEMQLRVYDPDAWHRDQLKDKGKFDQNLRPGPPRQLDPPVRSQTAMRAVAKRTLDLIGSSLGLLVSAIPIAGAALAIKLTSKGDIFFCQQREGMGGKPFTIYKLRTMFADAEQRQADLLASSERDGPAFKMKNDPRITPVGHFLRKTCIDELPQFLNVLLGHMSMVGPRPLPIGESRSVEAWQRRRLDVKPGITGPWQVSKHEEIRFDDWMRMDLAYIDSSSTFDDLRLVAQTAMVPIKARGNH